MRTQYCSQTPHSPFRRHSISSLYYIPTDSSTLYNSYTTVPLQRVRSFSYRQALQVAKQHTAAQPRSPLSCSLPAKNWPPSPLSVTAPVRIGSVRKSTTSLERSVWSQKDQRPELKNWLTSQKDVGGRHCGCIQLFQLLQLHAHNFISISRLLSTSETYKKF